jgi:hypothetical protein
MSDKYSIDGGTVRPFLFAQMRLLARLGRIIGN